MPSATLGCWLVFSPSVCLTAVASPTKRWGGRGGLSGKCSVADMQITTSGLYATSCLIDFKQPYVIAFPDRLAYFSNINNVNSSASAATSSPKHPKAFVCSCFSFANGVSFIHVLSLPVMCFLLQDNMKRAGVYIVVSQN